MAPAEFKGSLQQFRRLDASLPGVYRRFTLVCPALSAKLRPIEAGLTRYRCAKPFYDDASSLALTPTKHDLDERLREIGLVEDDITFLQACVSLDVGHADLRQDGRALETFAARLYRHPDYADKLLSALEPAFAALLRALQDNRGQVLGRADINRVLREAVGATVPGEDSVTLWMQNWTRETFDIPADHTIDWSPHFDRSTRRVPVPETWNNELLPELKSLRDRIQVERIERLIRLRGKYALSSGIALGATFLKFDPAARSPARQRNIEQSLILLLTGFTA